MNTIIDNLLNFNKIENNDNENHKTNKATNISIEDAGPPTVSIEKIIPSLQQGNNFTQYQDKIKKNIETTLGKNGNIENFANNENNENEERLKQEYNQLFSDYKETLSKYNALTKQIQSNSSNYIERTDPNNKYLNKIIRFSRTGQLLYVTKQGVAKYIPSMEILNSISGKNGCPNTTGNYISIDIPWLNEYSVEGTQLPTNPPLIIGKNMQLNESCGNEGSNVFVNKMMSSNPTPTYVGCYQENEQNPSMAFIGETLPSNGATSGTYNLDKCEEAAISGGYQYFSLQNADPSTGLGICAVGSDVNQIKNNGPGYTFVPLWASNTTGKPTTYAVVTKNGTLTVCDSNGNAYYTSPNGTSCDQVYSTSWNTDAGGNDLSYRTNQTVDSCKNICNNTQNCTGFAFNTSTKNSCWIKTGKLSNTTKNKARTLYKKTVDTSQCNYFLALQTDGNMCIYKGEPNKNLGGIWCTMTNGKQQIPNVNYSVAKSKYGMSFLKKDQILNKGDWVVSDDGKLLLIMQNDGNLVLYTFKSSCFAGTGNNRKNYYGSNLANALYDIGSVGIKSNMGQMAYIDADSQIHPYSSANISYSNTYSSPIQNTNIQGNDIPGGAVSNVSDVTQCMDICNKYSDCNAFVYDTSAPSPVCYPKKISNSDIYSIDIFKTSFGKTAYIRDKKIVNGPSGIDNSVNNVDSITYQNYSNKGGKLQKNYLFNTVNSVQKQQLSQLRDKLNLLSSQLNNKLILLKQNNITMVNGIKLEIINKIEGFQGLEEPEEPEGLEGFEVVYNDSYFKTIETNKKIKKVKKTALEIDNILRDVNIKTLQQSYSYMLWSILAIGATIVAIRVKNT
jgi:hypothetical protein